MRVTSPIIATQRPGPRPYRVLAALLAITVLCALGVSACRSLITGNQGNLRFSYVADDQLLDFNKPIAAGGKLEFKVETAGVFSAVTLVSARSEDDSVLKVVSFSGDRLIVQGVATGNVLLSVVATKGDGTEVEDDINLNVRVPDELILTHSCDPSASEGLWLTGNKVFFPYEMKENNRPVIGFGFHPLTFDPPVMSPDSATQDQQWMHLTTPTTPQVVTLKSTIDATIKTMRMVAAGDIDGATVQNKLLEGWVGQSTWVYVLPTVGSKPVCQAQTALSVSTDTPEFCTVSHPSSDGGNAPKNEWGWVKIEGKSVGVCKFTVNYEAGNGGQGTATQLSTDINEVVQP